MKTLILAAFSTLFVFGQDAVPEPAREWTHLNEEGARCYQSGNLVCAELQFRSALFQAKAFGDADPRYWTSLSNVGLTLERRSKWSEAEPILRRAAELRERALGPHDPGVAQSLVDLAAVLHLVHRDADADPILRRVLAIAADSGNEKLTAQALTSLGLTLMDRGEYARAEPVLRRAGAIFEKTGGEASLDTAKSINNLAMLYSAQHDYSKAAYQLRRALPVYEKAVGPTHPELIGPLNSMFTVLGAQKRFEEGEPFLRRALLIADRESSEVLRVVQLRSNLGMLEAHRGNYEAAEKIFADVIATGERAFGPDDPQLAGPLAACADTLRHLKQTAEARRAGDRASALKSSAAQSSFMPR